MTSFEISLDEQTVKVVATAPFEDVTARIKKTGKEIRSAKIVDPDEVI